MLSGTGTGSAAYGESRIFVRTTSPVVGELMTIGSKFWHLCQAFPPPSPLLSVLAAGVLLTLPPLLAARPTPGRGDTRTVA